MQKLFQVINKGKYKNTKFNQFLNYCSHNKNEIKVFPEIGLKAKGTSCNCNMKDNFIAKYCHNSAFLGGVSFKQNKEFQITLSL